MSSKIHRATATALLLMVFGAGTVWADEIVFNNGDRLTGKVEMMDGGKLKIKSTIAGDVTVDIKSVKTFSTDAPITLRMNDGAVYQKKVAAAEPGKVKVVTGPTTQPQSLALSSVKKINPQESWSGALTIGGLLTRGNTNTDQLNVALDAARRTDADRITVGAGYIFGRQRNQNTGEKITTTDNWFAFGKYDYFITPKFYAFGGFRVEKDRIAELELRLTPSAGFGYQFIDKPDFHLSGEAGLAWVYESYTNDGTEQHIAARLGYHVDKKLNDKVTLFHNLTYLPSLEELNDYNLITDAGFRAALTDKMFTELKIQFNYDSTPAPGASSTDLRYILGVGWKF